LNDVTRSLVGTANSQSRLAGTGTTFNSVSPQLDFKIDRNQVMRQGVNIQDVFGTLGATLGSTYVNDFNRFSRAYQVKVSAEPRYRSDRERALGYSVRNDKGEMVPLGAFTRIEDTTYPNRVMRFNMYPAAQMMGAPAKGVSSGDAMKLMEQLSKAELPAGMDSVWTTVSFQQARAGSAGPVFLMAILMVFLVLAAQYESWSLPLAVVLTIPIARLGAVLAVNARAMPIDVFVQAGLVLLVGLAAKNAILIVEFARVQEDEGKEVKEAALLSAKLRFRPIVMTSLAFILGVIPLATAKGAGAISRTEIGTSVLGGMTFATVVGVLVAPVLYVVVRKMSKGSDKPKAKAAEAAAPAEPTAH
jgi:HAE1 family hydrophobic/amphiphilic exporter-1